MSDQGERGVRWTDMSENEPRDGFPQGPGADEATGPRTALPEAEEFAPADPAGGKAAAEQGAAPHDVWGRVEEPPAQEPADREADREADDVKVAPVAESGAEAEPAARREEEAPQWEGLLFDEGAGDSGPGDSNYVPAVPTGSGQPAKPGKPSSGNWQMPDWMADEESADAKLGGSPKPSGDGFDDGGGRSRLVLFGGVGLLVVALIAAGAVYFVKSGGDESGEPAGNADKRAAAEQSEATRVQLPPDKPLATFKGRPSRMLGRVNDTHSGLSYPRFAAPWQLPTKKNKLGTPGWSGQQIMVTERRAQQLWYGQLLTGTLAPTLLSAYQGPESVKNVTALAAQGYEGQYYAFPHKTAPLASQELTVGGRKGWLIASYLTYQRDGVRATGEVVATAVVDTGREAPAVVFASMPNTHKKYWPDLNAFLTHLKLAR
ncbi:hypothetical protein [Actinomadura meyerae]|nr:hypothetical protein [Actinomadura meyerae]